MDLFSRPYEEYIVKRTKSGAIVSIIAIVIMTIIFITELSYYMKTDIVDNLYVNTTWSDKFHVSFDIALPEISCSLLSIDIFDETGLPQKGVTSEIYKHRLTKSGVKEGLPELHILGDSIRHEKQLNKNNEIPPPDDTVVEEECGPCYGAGECCKTCDDVKKAYKHKGWVFNPVDVKQCEKRVKLDNWKEQNSETGGCQLFGKLELNKVSGGHFHIAPHKVNMNISKSIYNSSMIDIDKMYVLEIARCW